MIKVESTDKYFGQALRQLLDKRKLTYRDFAKKSNVSKTYLSKILVHNVTPSRDIIKKIALALKIDPNYFKEWRIMKIIEKLEKYYYGLNVKDIEKIEKLIEAIEKKLPELSGKRADKYTPVHMLDITEFNEMQKRTLKLLYRDFQKVTKIDQKLLKKSEEDVKLYESINMTGEFGGLIEKYRHLDSWDATISALRDYKRIYIEKKK